MNFVTFDPENGDLNLELPEEWEAFHDELCLALSEKFMGTLDDAMLVQMNAFVQAWMSQHTLNNA